MHCLAKLKLTENLHKDRHQADQGIKITTTIGARIRIGKDCEIHAWTQQRVDGVPCVNLERICLTRRTDSMQTIHRFQLIRTILCRQGYKIALSKTKK